jgi:hypothetical protein
LHTRSISGCEHHDIVINMSDASEKTKRELEPDQAEDAAEEQPAAKRVKTDADAAAAEAGEAGAAEGDAEMAEDAAAAAADDAQAEDGEEAAEDDDAAEEQVAVEPVKLGYRTFKSASEASEYIVNILKRAKPGENLNEVRSSHLAAGVPVLYCQQQRALSHCTADVSTCRVTNCMQSQHQVPDAFDNYNGLAVTHGHHPHAA